MEPNPDLVAHLTQALQRFHVESEAIFWALRDAVNKNIPLTKEASND